MPLTGPIPGIDLAGETIGAIISLLITYYAHKAYRLSGQRSLFLLYLGFLLIGFGFTAQSISLALGVYLPVNILPSTLQGIDRLFYDAIIVGSRIHWILEIVGFATLFVAYLLQSRSTQTTTLPSPTNISLQIASFTLARIIFDPRLEVVIFLLVVFTLIQVIVTYLPQRHRSTTYVILGFLLIALAHLAFLLFEFFPTTEDVIYALGHVLQIGGFLLLLAMLLSTTRGK